MSRSSRTSRVITTFTGANRRDPRWTSSNVCDQPRGRRRTPRGAGGSTRRAPASYVDPPLDERDRRLGELVEVGRDPARRPSSRSAAPRRPRRPRRAAAACPWANTGPSTFEGSTEWNGTPLKKYSCQSPPERVSHGVSTASAAKPNPVCGETKTLAASTRASWSRIGRSNASTACGPRGEQAVDLAARDPAGGATAAVSEPPDEREGRVGEPPLELVEDGEPRGRRRVEVPGAASGRHHGDRAASAELRARGFPLVLGQLEAELLVRGVVGRRLRRRRPTARRPRKCFPAAS